MTIKHLIIGASAAGISCATKLRELDAQGEILVIDAEEKLPCNRCLLSDLLAGEKGEQDIFVRNPDLLKQQNINLMLGTKVVEILPQENCVKLINGQKIFYETLFLGIGKTGFIPDVPGANLIGVFAFYGMSDVTAILNFIQNNDIRYVTVVGAGLTGLECANALLDRGFEVTLVERHKQVLSCQIDLEGAQVVQNLMQKHKISLRLGQVVEKISGQTAVNEVLLSKDGPLKTDMVIFAIGGRPNTEIAMMAGVEVSNYGVLTNTLMQTNIPNIFAGGDICAVRDLISGKTIQSCLWTEASIQGSVAAHNILGMKHEYLGALVITSSNIFGTPIVSCGDLSGELGTYKEIVRCGENFYQKYLTSDQALKGFVMIGKIENIGVLRKALVSKTPFLLV